MTDYVIEAELREETGRSATRRLRRVGKLPGIIYGGGKPDLAITMDFNAVSKLLNEEQFHTSMLEVKVKGSPWQKQCTAKRLPVGSGYGYRHPFGLLPRIW